jgi:hypothetical protein
MKLRSKEMHLLLLQALLAPALLLLLPYQSFGQRQPDTRSIPIPPDEGKKQAQEVVAEMLNQRPEQSATNTGVLRIRNGDRKESEVPVKIATVPTATNWFSLYEAIGQKADIVTRLQVIHSPGADNHYIVTKQGDAPKQLKPSEAMLPFAGSDFWAADLGLEFLYWPNQRLLKKEMRHSRFCSVLESSNPSPAKDGYSRVVAWIENEAPHGVVHADAYDARNKRIKEFDPTKVEKVEGVYQLKSMQIRDLRSGSQTVMEFDLEK